MQVCHAGCSQSLSLSTEAGGLGFCLGWFLKVLDLWIGSMFCFMLTLFNIPTALSTAHIHRLVERIVCLVSSSVGWSHMLVCCSGLVCCILFGYFQHGKDGLLFPVFVLSVWVSFLRSGSVGPCDFGTGFLSKPYNRTFSNLPYATLIPLQIS